MRDDNFFKKEKGNLKKSILIYFKEKNGFCLNSTEDSPSIHASYCALGAVKSMADKKCGEQLTYDEAAKKLTPERIDTVMGLLKKCSEDHSRLIVDSPRNGGKPTMEVLYNASQILWKPREEKWDI